MGVELAAAFCTVLEEYNLTEKVLAVTCDNVSNNDVMIRELTKLVPGFEGEVSHIRCFLHVINLVAKSLIHQFDMCGGQTDVQDDEQQELTNEANMEDLPSDDGGAATDNDDGFVDEVERMEEAKKELHKYTIRPVEVILVKVSTLSKSNPCDLL